jgi:WXXGXW repeat (2 copies)
MAFRCNRRRLESVSVAMNPNSSLAKQKSTLLRPVGFALGLSLLAGCVVERPPRQVYVEPAPPPAEVVIVRDAPPVPREEIVTVRPGPRFVWCAGYWRHDGREYVWVPGHWVRPPRVHAIWVAPHWEVRGGGYFFVDGVWR